MAYLGDFLGQLLSEIVIARAQVDLETLRIAEQYASHPLLKNFPIPHLRLPTITIDLPYVVEKIEEIENGGSPRGKFDIKVIENSFLKLLKKEINNFQINLTPEIEKKIQQQISKAIGETQLPDDISISVSNIAELMTEETVKIIRSNIESSDKDGISNLKNFSTSIKEKALREFISLRKLPPRLNVLLTKQQLSEIKSTDLLSQLHLTINEEGKEWVEIDLDGKKIDKLVAE